MKEYERFQLLSWAQQGEYIIREGTYLAFRYEDNYGVNLYWLGSFYCEIWLEQDCLELHRFRSFTQTSGLDAYLPFVHLPADVA